VLVLKVSSLDDIIDNQTVIKMKDQDNDKENQPMSKISRTMEVRELNLDASDHSFIQHRSNIKPLDDRNQNSNWL